MSDPTVVVPIALAIAAGLGWLAHNKPELFMQFDQVSFEWAGYVGWLICGWSAAMLTALAALYRKLPPDVFKTVAPHLFDLGIPMLTLVALPVFLGYMMVLRRVARSSQKKP